MSLNPNASEPHLQPPQSQEKRQTPEELISSIASNLASQPLHISNPEVWGVLSAINDNARKRRQGFNVHFTADEHCIGRLVPDKRFLIESNAVSGNHCKIYRKKEVDKDADDQSKLCVQVFIKDTSTNGTFLNWEKLTKKGPEAELHHGDIISFGGPPHHEKSFAFVFRDVFYTSSSFDLSVKRKPEEFISQGKRLKGIGIGAPEGPLSLDDFRSLQRSNADLRKQLNCHLVTIETLRNDNRAALENYEKEIKELNTLAAQSYMNQIEDLKNSLEDKKQEFERAAKTTAEQKSVIIDLTERLNVSSESCAEANEIINNQKVSISRLKAQLNEERDQRRQEREKAAIELKAAVQKVLSEAKNELMQYSEAVSKLEKEQQELISKHQESVKELSLAVETMRTKLEENRQKLVTSDNKVRQLEAENSEEQKTSADRMKKIEGLENKLMTTMKDLQSEKSAREEAWEKVSSLELQINTAKQDLEYERQRLNGARERIVLRETQLRAFYSTTEEISALLVKQQGQLKSMQKTLEDEENNSVDSELNPHPWSRFNKALEVKQLKACQTNRTEDKSSASAQRDLVNTVTEDASATEKQECDSKAHKYQHTQEVDSANADLFIKGGCGAAVHSELEPRLLHDGSFVDTELFMETECQTIRGGYVDMNEWEGLAGETMPLDDHGHLKVGQEDIPLVTHEAFDNCTNNIDVVEDTEGRYVFTTQDLMASELIGSWACSTAPSVHDENYSQKSRDNENDGVEGLLALHNSSSQAESQNNGDYALSKMIHAVSSDLKDQFSEAQENDNGQEKEINGAADQSDSEAVGDANVNYEGHAALCDVEVEDSENEDESDNSISHRSRIKLKGAAVNGVNVQDNPHAQLGDAIEEDHPTTQQDFDG